MNPGKTLVRISAIMSLCIISLPISSISSKAEDAAAFLHKDKSQWSKLHRAERVQSIRRVSKMRNGSKHKMVRSSGKLRLSGSKALFASAARRAGVPVRMALAVIAVESRGNCRAVGRRGELGPLQIKPRTARGLGYRGSNAALRSCGAGLYWGMKHLAISYRKCRSPVLHNKGLAGSCSRTGYSKMVMRLAGRV